MILEQPLRWEFSKSYSSDALFGLNNRANYESKILEEDEKEMISILGEAVSGYYSLKSKLLSLIWWINRYFHPINGKVVELGAGTAIATSILSKYNVFKKIYAVEYSEHYVTQIMPKVFSHFDADVYKIQRVVGDFNKLELPDNSIDLIIENASFHHSENLELTLKESHRILKKGKYLICFERAHPDDTQESRLEQLRNEQLSNVIKKKWGIPIDTNYTRADSGEHEYRFSEWKEYFRSAGFEVYSFRSWGYNLRGLSRVYSRFPHLDPQIITSLLTAKFGKKDLSAYGYAKNHCAFILHKYM